MQRTINGRLAMGSSERSRDGFSGKLSCPNQQASAQMQLSRGPRFQKVPAGIGFVQTRAARSEGAAAQILATSDLVSVFPLNIARHMIKSHGLVLHRLSRPPKPIETAMIWLRRLDNQPAHAWLREVIVRVVQ
jgi:DNA-binding transcriptional LysR family regulator